MEHFEVFQTGLKPLQGDTFKFLFFLFLLLFFFIDMTFKLDFSLLSYFWTFFYNHYNPCHDYDYFHYLYLIVIVNIIDPITVTTTTAVILICSNPTALLLILIYTEYIQLSDILHQKYESCLYVGLSCRYIFCA